MKFLTGDDVCPIDAFITDTATGLENHLTDQFLCKHREGCFHSWRNVGGQPEIDLSGDLSAEI